MEHGIAGMLLGLGLFLLPGAAWSLAALPRAAGGARVAVAVVLSFTLLPAALLLANVLFDAPIRLGTIASLAVALGMAGLAVRLAPWARSVGAGA